MKMNKKEGILIICAAILVLVFIETASAKTWYVDDDLQDFPYADFAKIQDAVNIALPGDTVIVYNGTYIENIKVDKGLTIRSENGTDTAIVRAAKNDDPVFEVSANYVNISGFTMEGATSGSAGISLHDTDYCNISDNNCSNNLEGIHLGHSNNNILLNNNCSNNRYGIYLFDSKNNKLKGNIMAENGIVILGYLLSHYTHEIDKNNRVNEKPVYYWANIEGGIIPDGAGQIILVNCTNVAVENQNLKNASVGIQIAFSSGITIKNNNCSNNSEDGIHLGFSNNNELKGNTMVENGIVIWGHSLSHYAHEIDKNNTANGKPVYYWKDVEGGRIPDGAGQIILVNSTNIAIKNQNLYNASVGIQIAFSSFITIKNNECPNNREGIHLGYSNNNSISNNNCSNNGRGIFLDYSSKNSISNNNCLNNGENGIYLEDSYNNVIYLNNFINKNDNVDSYNSHNIWNSTEKITYIYNGKKYKNYLGNYWDDYKEKYPDAEEIEETGIRDTPYNLDSNRDYHPLMVPFENYFIYPVVSSEKIEINTKVEVGETIIHYENRSFWKESDFLKILENKEEFESNIIENFNESLSKYGERGEYATNIDVEFEEARKSTTLRCNIYDTITKSDNRYYATFRWLLTPLGLDFIDDDFEEYKDGLSWKGTINSISTNITLKFPPQKSVYLAWHHPNGHCHAHVWWTMHIFDISD